MEQGNEFHGLFVWKKSGNMGDQFPLPVQATSIDYELGDVVWNKGVLWVKTDTLMELEKENFAKGSEYGDPDITMGGESGKLSDLFVDRLAFQKEGDGFISNTPIFCAMTKYQGKDVYLFDDCVSDVTLIATNVTSGEKSKVPAWIIPFSENHPDDYFSDDIYDSEGYDFAAMREWPFYLLDEEEADNDSEHRF